MSFGFKNLKVYIKAYQIAIEIFEASKAFPTEEKYSLTDQIRRSSRSVCANIAEAYRKRRYPKHFTSKITDSDAEASETIVWNDFAFGGLVRSISNAGNNTRLVMVATNSLPL